MTDFPRFPEGRDRDEEERLRRLLEETVSDIEPREGLGSIHARTKVTPMNRKRPWLLAVGAAAVATAATIAAVTVLGEDTSGSGRPQVAASESSSPEPSAEPSAEATEPSAEPSEATTPTQPAASTETVPVYYTGETTRGPRLYREFHRTEVTGGDVLEAAVGEALGSTPEDGDYRTDWPQGTTASSSFDGGSDEVISIELRNDGTDLRRRPAGMSGQQARIAVEQLIYTAQAAVQERAPVQFYLRREGTAQNRTDTLLGVPVSEPLTQGDPVDVLAQVWIIEPGEGDEVGPTFTVSGLAAAFEANVQWELMKGDQEIRRGFTTAEECCTMAPYEFKVRNVPPGDYTLVVHDSDPSAGEGPGPWTDTKDVTVTR